MTARRPAPSCAPKTHGEPSNRPYSGNGFVFAITALAIEREANSMSLSRLGAPDLGWMAVVAQTFEGPRRSGKREEPEGISEAERPVDRSC